MGADDVIALLIDFLASYGMTHNAAAALCNYIDDEGMTEDFASLLKENGLVIEASDTLEGDDDIE